MAERAEAALPEHLTETTAPTFHQAQHFCDSPPARLEAVFAVSPRELLLGFLAAAESIRNTQGDAAEHWAEQPWDRAEELGMEVREPVYLRHLLIANTSLRTPLSPEVQTEVI